MKKRIFYGCVIALGLIVLILVGWLFLSNLPTDITSGFSGELPSMLQERYEVSLPDTAVFLKGYYDNAPRDDAIHVTFTVEKEDVERMLTGNWEQMPENSYNQKDAISLMGTEAACAYSYINEPYTVLYVSGVLDDTVTCGFVGRYPPWIIM